MSAPEDHFEACPVCLQAHCDHSDEEKAEHLKAIASGDERPFNSADEEQVDKRAKGSRQKEKQADQDLKWIMSDARGRRFVWSLLSRCGIYRNSYLAGRGQSEATAFYEGERNIGLELIARVQATTPKAHTTMTEENSK